MAEKKNGASGGRRPPLGTAPVRRAV